MNITPKIVTNTVSLSFTISKLNDVHISYDDPIHKILRVSIPEAVPPQTLTIKGVDYENLGQWTDETLNDTIVAKYGLEVIT